jgi:hypothetical protein
MATHLEETMVVVWEPLKGGVMGTGWELM